MTTNHNTPNIGKLFYKDYYSHLNTGKAPEENRDSKILNRIYAPYATLCNSMKYGSSKQQIELTTQYPGLLIGSGYTHEAEKNTEEAKKELKLGFFFDHATGLPLIPASSVKGVLRSVFPSMHLTGKDGKPKKKNAGSRNKYIKKLLTEMGCTPKGETVELLEKEIFEGIKNNEAVSIYERDIFHDAVLAGTNNKDGLFLGNDYITPHNKNVLKNPVPIEFLKILPEVTFRFQFDLKDYCEEGKVVVSKEQKLQLFKNILKDIGIGAKTNVGYGQFVEK